jgi:hypothetical protein
MGRVHRSQILDILENAGAKGTFCVSEYSLHFVKDQRHEATFQLDGYNCEYDFMLFSVLCLKFSRGLHL